LKDLQKELKNIYQVKIFKKRKGGGERGEGR